MNFDDNQPKDPFQGFRGMTNMNEQLRRMFGPQFLQNMMKQLPMQELNALQNMPEWTHMFGTEATDVNTAKTKGALPRIDIYQTRQEVVAVVELPGLTSPQDVELQVKPETLTVSGSLEGRFASFRKDRFYLDERFRGSFERTVSLPVRVRPQQARAQYKNGLLEIRIIKDTRKGTGKSGGHAIPVDFA
ncbi:Hsp20/alpha crystallin family protein [Tumebacillus sp. DT12]|uniref:Hsp20/alpha crystallin family protein n=1 Tax=Tumebacillus lacus TaxID=2995335 RepID=A0ABT3WZY8_9BACL|nr:Hsp20/alpha crystallin family protein [Tumebacillus lacus]MCX7568855.1 Hsp20/alpha crystallin family protein [Tumebacillus lacus]